MRNPLSKLPSGFLLSSSPAYQSRMFTTGSGEMSTSFGKTKSTKQNKPCHFMLIQRLIPTAVWWGSQELNCNPNTNTSHCQEMANAPPITRSFQNVLSIDEYIVLERVQTYAALILQIYLSYRNNPTCLEMWMGKWSLWVEANKWCLLLICSSIVLRLVAAASLEHLPRIYHSFRKKSSITLRVLPFKNERYIKNLFRVLCTSTTFRDKDTSVFTSQIYF